MPVKVGGVGDDDVVVVDAAAGVWLAVVCPVELAGSGGVPAVVMAVGVRLPVVRSVAMAEVDSGAGGVVDPSVVVGAGVVVGGLVLKQYLTGQDGRRRAMNKQDQSF